MKSLWDVMPEMVARPYGYGTYEKMEDIHFFLCSFHKLTGNIPDIENFPALVAELHRRSSGDVGQFGFPHRTYGMQFMNTRLTRGSSYALMSLTETEL